MKKFFTIFFLFFVAIVFLFSHEKKHFDNSKRWEKKNPIKNKLVGPLKEAVEIYKTTPKLTPEAISNYRLEKLNSARMRAGLTAIKISKFSTQKNFQSKAFITKSKKIVNLSTGKTVSIQSTIEKKPLLMELLIDPAVQKSWGNPPYDVLKCDIEISGDTSLLKNYNIKIRAVSDTNGKKIVNAEVPSTELKKLIVLRDVFKITPVLKRKLDNDKATYATGAARIRLKENGVWSKGYTGENTIVGIIDSGIDWTHEDFIKGNGETRILYLWDADPSNTTPGKTPADLFGGALSTLNYGTVWTKQEIDSGLCTATDTNGHGTHVSGIAAGNGRATGKYTGMAPNADIIFVKGLDNNGILFIYELSKRLGKPCSVNMSYGPAAPFVYISLWPDSYPADGTSSEAQTIAGWNNSYGSGHIPVKAAGNEGHWNTYTDLSGGSYPYMNGAYHIQGRGITSANSHTINIYDYTSYWNSLGWGTPSSSDFPFVQFGIWYEAPVKITIVSPSGTMGSFQHGDPDSFIWNGDGYVEYYMNNPQASNGAYYGTFSISYATDPVTQPTPGDWQIIVEPLSGSANYDVWVSNLDLYNSTLYILTYKSLSYFTQNYSHSNYIIDEGASPYEITVGSWTTRESWADKDGNSWTYMEKPWMGAISDFSSPGPSRDRRVKPDIAAPGEIIISSASKDASFSTADYADDEHVTMSGTSMATPVVTGGIALIQQKLGGKTVSQIRNILKNWARQDLHTRHFSQNGFGYGKFNVISLNEQPIANLTQDKEEVILDNNKFEVNLDGSKSSDYEDFPLSYKWKLEEKPEGSSPTLTPNNDKATLKVDPNIEGKYRVSLIVNDSIIDSEKVYSSWIEAHFYPVFPPANFKLERIENNLGFSTEYINRLTWEKNPENKVDIAKYKLYRKKKGEDDSSYTLIKEFSPDTFSYDERGLGKTDLFVYKLTAVSSRGKESDPVIVSN